MVALTANEKEGIMRKKSCVLVLIMLLCKAQTGLGTVVLMFGLGPFVQFFSAVIQKFILPKRV